MLVIKNLLLLLRVSPYAYAYELDSENHRLPKLKICDVCDSLCINIDWSVIFPYNSLYTQAVAYTMYFELGKPVWKPAFTGQSQRTQTIYIVNQSKLEVITCSQLMQNAGKHVLVNVAIGFDWIFTSIWLNNHVGRWSKTYYFLTLK